jgi:hypothetical protein
VNNAGAFLSKPFVDYSEADFATMEGVNLAGFFHVSQRAAAAMLRQHRGHIVTITTSLVDQPMAALPAALAAITKGGLDAVTRSLAIEYAGRGIRVNAVSPGIIKTPMHPVEAHGFFATLHPMGRMGAVAEVVEAVLYLETAAAELPSAPLDSAPPPCNQARVTSSSSAASRKSDQPSAPAVPAPKPDRQSRLWNAGGPAGLAALEARNAAERQAQPRQRPQRLRPQDAVPLRAGPGSSETRSQRRMDASLISAAACAATEVADWLNSGYFWPYILL